MSEPNDLLEFDISQEVERLRPSSALRFNLGSMTFALRPGIVKAVAELRMVCSVPYRRRTAFLGLIAYGGDILPCCSVARLMGLVEAATGGAMGPEARMIILEERAGERWAFPVDAVLGIASGTLEPVGSTKQANEWVEHMLRDESGATVDVLRPETLFARLARAVG